MGERRCLGAGEYADAFFWLSDACISCTCYGVGDPAVGLSSTADEGSFKCYMADTGLLVAQLFADSEQTPHEVYRDILLGKLETNEGMFAENAVAQQFAAAGRRLFFYSRRDDAASENTMEVDFLISKGYDNAAGADVARRGEVVEALRHEVAREVQGEVRGPRGHAVRAAPQADERRGRPREAPAVHGAPALGVTGRRRGALDSMRSF